MKEARSAIVIVSAAGGSSRFAMRVSHCLLSIGVKKNNDFRGGCKMGQSSGLYYASWVIML